MGYRVHFDNIASIVTKELQEAHHTIHLAMAWFTNEVLFRILCQKAAAGVIVKVLVLNDDINTQGKLWYDELLLSGGLISLVGNRSELMHHKFCVIDNKTVISGSYNWTNAAQYNDENIIVVKDNFNFADAFVNEYYSLYRKYVGQPSYKAIQQISTTAIPEKTKSIEKYKIVKEYKVSDLLLYEALGLTAPLKK